MIGSFKQNILKMLGPKLAKKLFILKVYLEYFLCTSMRRILTSKSNQETSELSEIMKLSSDTGQTFFGYYDVTPFNKDNSLVLAMIGPHDNRPPLPNEEITIGYFDLKSRKFQHVGTTSTWCWQMGCRLQWFPEDENELIIYNKMVNGCYGSVVQNIRTKKIIRQFKKPVYSISADGKWAVSLNFSRLNRMRPGYGYVDIQDSTKSFLQPDSDGVWFLNLKSGDTSLLFNLDYLAKFEPLPSMAGAEHYINHLCVNPSSKDFIFFHLWVNNSRSHSRLMICSSNGDNLRVLEDHGEVSHYTWKSEKELLVTILYPNKTTKYQLYCAVPRQYAIVGENILTEDGHPSYSLGCSLLLTDTYPDVYSEQDLLLYSQEKGLIELGRFFHPLNSRFKFSGETRCDLHPRWDRNGHYVCFDSAYAGKRSLYIMNIEKIIAQH
jgi:hypothetical protein